MKRFLTFFLINTVVYGVVLAIFEYFSAQTINWWQLLVQVIVFGAIMGLIFTFLNNPKKG